MLTFVGIISAEKVELNANAGVTLGYLFAAAVCFAFATMKLPLREKEADELALDAEEGLAPPPGRRLTEHAGRRARARPSSRRARHR